MNTTRYRELLLRYIEDKCSASEIEELFEYIAHYDGPDVLKEVTGEEIENAGPACYRIPAKKTRALKAAIEAGITSRKIKSPARPLPLFFKVAASVVLLMLCTWLIYRFGGAVTGEHITHTTAYGEIREVTLPDRSVVILNSNSRLRYDKDWSSTATRKVALEGEAFFKVTHTENSQPFLVHTRNNVAVEVLGTEFNVNDRHLNTRVVLHSGKVKLDIDNQPEEHTILMESGELVEVTDKTVQPDGSRQVTRKLVNTAMYIAWKNNELVFQDTRLADILVMIEDNYGYRVTVLDERVLNERFNGTFPSRNVEVLLKTLAKVYPLGVDGKKVTVGI